MHQIRLASPRGDNQNPERQRHEIEGDQADVLALRLRPRLERGQAGHNKADQQTKKLSTHAARPKGPPSGRPSARWARARLSAESESEVSPHAMGERANRSVEGKCRRTRSRSCSTATIVCPFSRQRCSKLSSSSVVLSSTAAKGSSSKMTSASCKSSRANRARWN